ncbi:hypothetical protein GCM10027449_33110 [Sinomonas notoginsengisoli]
MFRVADEELAEGLGRAEKPEQRLAAADPRLDEPAHLRTALDEPHKGQERGIGVGGDGKPLEEHPRIDALKLSGREEPLCPVGVS